ncbi:MAG: outer membrane lipid asymmetry maintenance protein MlaD [Polycyclovorans sp.]|jgi:phospholipid/cholesterol/gamma-HCH transport system substrate-binding protein|nr:outer membrane lipid asymmetry maintenance protein MlaD [Gammaproteobacteria bacterium]MDP1543387.1 outer membrane lipid asymmetry maintenance protein MlaD [Polycyclovorans sp.]MEC8849052.1 outer membrane lipid asymmetry maintenance protein MlaD [Pseudomonadota bacterium]|tara:strand:- start:1623 stop:2090 length:468 start_codon:yes stop_codon:yes gene_type:complete
MVNRSLEVLVGFFICLGIAAIFVLTFRVASLDTVGSGADTYRITGQFQNIGGLKQGSAVTLAGVRVGRVTQISIDPHTFQATVHMTIDGQYDNLPEDSSASILTAGLLGEQYIGLTPGGMPEPLTDGSELMLTQSALVLENLIGQFLSNMATQQE